MWLQSEAKNKTSKLKINNNNHNILHIMLTYPALQGHPSFESLCIAALGKLIKRTLEGLVKKRLESDGTLKFYFV